MAGSRERSARGGGRRVTQADVARRAGVSRGLVSLALSGSELVSEASRERIEAAVRDLGYRVNVTASSLASGRSGTIGLVLPNLRNPFFDFLAQALQEAAGERSLTVLMTLAGGDDDGWAVSTTMVDMGVEGLVLVSPALRAESIRALGRDVPVCLVGHAEVGGCVDTVRLDEADAARVVVEHLAAAGAGRLVYLTPTPQDDPSAAERGQALSDAAHRAGLALEVVVDGARGASDLRRQVSAQHEGVVGVVAHNDVVALDALAVLGQVGRWVPLVSYDNTFLARREEFSLTSVEQPVGAMAHDAVRFLCRRSGREPLEDAAPGGGTPVPAPDGTPVPAGPSSQVAAAPGGPAMPARNVTVAPVLAVRRSSTPRG